MEEAHQLAIRLKYEGYLYEDISKELKGKLKPGTLRGYFATDGLLYADYMEYATKQNLIREAEGRAVLKKQLSKLAGNMIKTIDLIIEEADSQLVDSKDPKIRATARENRIRLYKSAFYLSERILDRAGLPVSISTENTNSKEKAENYEQFLKRLGISPKTGHRNISAGTAN